MPEIIILNEYEINSDSLLKMMYNENYMKYLIKNTEDFNDYKIVKKKLINNETQNNLYVETNTICCIKLPNYIKKIIGNYSSYTTTSKATYNIKEKSAQVNIESFYFKLLLLTINYSFTINNIDNNKFIKKTKFYFNSSIPIIGNKINNIIKDIIKTQENNIYEVESKWIKQEQNKMIKDDVKLLV